MNALPNRFAVFALGIAVYVLSATATPGSIRSARAEELKRVSERLIPFESGGLIKIQDKNGKLIVDTWPRHEVRVQITRVVRAGDRAKGEELMKDLTTDIEVRSDRIDIVSQFPKRTETLGLLDFLGRKNVTVNIDYYVQVPEESDVDLSTSNGEVRVRGIQGKVEATTTNGDVHAENVKGEVVLTTTNGEVHLADIAGNATAHTTNGSVVAEIRRLSPKGSVELETTNGNVAAYFGSDLKADLEAQTTNGRVSIGFPIVREGVKTSRTIRGTIQGGGAKITLGTTNGDVEVRRIAERRR